MDRKEQENRKKTMMQLEKLLESYSIDDFRAEIDDDIEETKEGVVHMGRSHNR